VWTWISGVVNRISVTAMLREQLAVARAENTKLIEEVAALKAELNIERTNHNQTKQKLERLTKEHEEQISLLRGIEFRRGKRTVWKWVAFYPKCHTALNPQERGWECKCPAGCGWVSNLSERDILEILNAENQ
jgi:hypothetical protein